MGEIEEGYYYLKDNKYTFIDYFNGISFKETCDFEIEEVLAPVPSYEEWQQMKAFCEEFNALNVAEENQRLKSLLKECKDNIGEDIDECTDPKIELIAKIGEVLK